MAMPIVEANHGRTEDRAHGASTEILADEDGVGGMTPP